MKFAPGTRDSITGKPYFYRSECGKYTVTLPAAPGQRYLAFKVAEKNSRLPSELLGGFPDAKAAKTCCEAHESKNAVLEGNAQ